MKSIFVIDIKVSTASQQKKALNKTWKLFQNIPPTTYTIVKAMALLLQVYIIVEYEKKVYQLFTNMAVKYFDRLEFCLEISILCE